MAKPAAPAAPFAGPPPVERLERELITPEGVDLKIRLAEASERAAAFLVDMLILVIAPIVLTIVLVGAVIGSGGKGAEAIAVVWLLGAFLLRNLYFIAFELGPRAATPGKRMLGLRVAARDGEPLTANAVFARNAMRELEVYLPLSFLVAEADATDAWIKLFGIVWCGVFVLFPLFNRDRLRVGDLVAGTWVVKAPRRRLLADVAQGAYASAGGLVFSRQQVDAYGVKELQVLEAVLRRYEPRTMTAVAARIRNKIGWSAGTGETDAAFLDAYYLALRGRLESRLLFGRRRRDKFDMT
jgi:uncharacterized RDD family membrane protein YckC